MIGPRALLRRGASSDRGSNCGTSPAPLRGTADLPPALGYCWWCFSHVPGVTFLGPIEWNGVADALGACEQHLAALHHVLWARQETRDAGLFRAASRPLAGRHGQA